MVMPEVITISNFQFQSELEQWEMWPVGPITAVCKTPLFKIFSNLRNLGDKCTSPGQSNVSDNIYLANAEYGKQYLHAWSVAFFKNNKHSHNSGEINVKMQI